MELSPYVKYVTNLISSFLSGKDVEPFPDSLDANLFFRFCVFHKIQNLVYRALANTQMPEELAKNFKASYFSSLNFMAVQQHYIEMVEKAFESSGIDYFIIKGGETAKFYPSADMRQSSDFDIYIGSEKAELARDVMMGLGFSVDDYADDDGHDKYVINNGILCELHRVLIQNDFPWKNECNKIPERVIKTSGKEHRFEMTTEDAYIYNLAHAANHIKTAGIGIRVFVDLWLMWSKCKDSLDMEHLEETLEKANLKRFEECARALFLYWFEGKETSDPTIMAMADFVAESGWIGTYNQYASAKLANESADSSSSATAKLESYKKMIFPSYEDLAKRYPKAKEHKILVPYYYVYRIVKSLFGKDKGAKRVMSEINTADLQAGQDLLKLKKEIGL
ncbi:MAG: nucleotidyltransferase family protein [Clostridia bacterium]|nr:nucleotidyltransferase family protein [Clostridia bacterium]